MGKGKIWPSANPKPFNRSSPNLKHVFSNNWITSAVKDVLFTTLKFWLHPDSKEWKENIISYGGQSEERYAENSAECGDEFAGPGRRYSVTVANGTERYLQQTPASQPGAIWSALDCYLISLEQCSQMHGGRTGIDVSANNALFCDLA